MSDKTSLEHMNGDEYYQEHFPRTGDGGYEVDEKSESKLRRRVVEERKSGNSDNAKDNEDNVDDKYYAGRFKVTSISWTPQKSRLLFSQKTILRGPR